MGAIDKPCYELPVRKIHRRGGSKAVSIAVHACRYLELKPGDWISFWETYWPGYLLIKKVLTDLKGLSSRDAHKSHPLFITQVQGTAKAMWMVIPKEICEMLHVEVGDLLLFGWTLNEGEFSIAGVLGGRNSEGKNNGACLRIGG
jgi:DNA-binding Xre family transcriptional regulator